MNLNFCWSYFKILENYLKSKILMNRVVDLISQSKELSFTHAMEMNEFTIRVVKWMKDITIAMQTTRKMSFPVIFDCR